MYAVYECYDAGGILLYVGVTGHLGKRLRTHKVASDWYGLMHRTAVTEFADPYAAAEHEARLITAHRPIHNRDRDGQSSVVWARKMRSDRDYRFVRQVHTLFRHIHWIPSRPRTSPTPLEDKEHQ